ncbi:MAG: hydrogenase expression/formation protein HypE [Candidatus Muproteobacteria bacterium RBG_16_64_11]|uniref:Hydrogenase expression/formation protein HypE n=1 Tax=Candidatus Muproteobacteria bacterium RBG_16_64_11 TaxID=1817758 RepID=A0A1F6TG32_9PROT|nr:MAG: hydrogenase expression/formation protein HypE [Candidatus Muproteobacteria bacterium RBG_16_64_11]
MSKFSLEVLQRCVFPFVSSDDPDVLLGATFGEDVALTRVGGDILVSHLDPIVGAIDNIGWLAVHVACNDIATTGIPPRWIHILVLVPQPEDEALLERIMRDAGQAAKEIGVSIIGGHTGYSANLARPLVAVTALGTAGGREPLRTRGARVGDHVLVTKGIAIEGTAILAQDFAEVARNLGLSANDLAEARRLMAQVSVVKEAVAIAAQGATAMHDVTRGGLLETLLELAALSGVALEVDASLLPVPPVVARFAKAFRFDPLWMISSGTLAATIPPEQVADVSRILKEQTGTPFAFVGRVMEGTGVHVRQNGDTVHYSDICCEKDELARMWQLYPREG